MISLNISKQLADIEQETLNKILSRLPEAKQKILKQILKDSEQYIPYKTGKLANSAKPVFEPDGIAFTAPYASFALDGVAPSGKPKVYSKSHNTKATSDPIGAAFEVNEDEWIEELVKELLKDA